MNQKVLFIRVGWMKEYNGPQPGDERPIRGGSYNTDYLGNEAFNFENVSDMCYGNSETRSKKRGYNLLRIDPACKERDRVENVLVVLVARLHGKDHQVIVGWYKSATVFKVSQPLSLSPRRNKTWDAPKYIFSSSVRDATLLPVKKRAHRIPGGLEGMGQANLRYARDERGRSNPKKWMKHAVAYISAYKGVNAIQDPLSISDEKEIARHVANRSQGFGSNAQENTAIDKHAMAMAKEHFKNNGYPACKDHSGNHPYDYLFEKTSGEKLFVEVKGIKGDGSKVIVTYGEVQHARQNSKNSALFIVHGIKVRQKHKKPVASGGETRVIGPPWRPRDSDLKAINYFYSVR